MKPIIIEVKIYPEQEEIDSAGEKYTSKRYMAKFDNGDILHWQQNVWPKDTGHAVFGGWLWHWSEEEWIEFAQKKYTERYG